MTSDTPHTSSEGDVMQTEPQVTTTQEIIGFAKTLFLLLAFALGFRVLVLEPFKIPSGSMKPTLHIGDYILVSKWDFGIHLPFTTQALAHWSSPQRSDIIVFKRPDDPLTPHVDESDVNIIKRVIAVAGDTVEVKNDQVFLNGSLLSETDYSTQWLDGGAKNFGPAEVPEGHVFLLGDNRDRSKDSRFWNPSPFLPASMAIGKARIIFWRWDGFKRIGTLLK